MKLAWAVVVLFLIIGVVAFFDALTSTHSVWVSIPLLVISGAILGPGLVGLLALLGLYDLAVEVNGHRLEFRRLPAL